MEPLRPADPRRVGAYEVLARLGSGGMGTVFLGRTAGGRTVAIKVVHAALAGDPGFRARFAREIAAARAVSGAFTAPVIDADADAPAPWLVTTYLPGHSLQRIVDGSGPLPPWSVSTLGAGLAEALVAIHRAGVVHRDLKPSNVLLTPDGPRVIDFGVARAAELSAVTRTGATVGSPGYLSPEQATGAESGPAGDVFSLGAVLTYAATGHRPRAVRAGRGARPDLPGGACAALAGRRRRPRPARPPHGLPGQGLGPSARRRRRAAQARGLGTGRTARRRLAAPARRGADNRARAVARDDPVGAGDRPPAPALRGRGAHGRRRADRRRGPAARPGEARRGRHLDLHAGESRGHRRPGPVRRPVVRHRGLRCGRAGRAGPAYRGSTVEHGRRAPSGRRRPAAGHRDRPGRLHQRRLQVLQGGRSGERGVPVDRDGRPDHRRSRAGDRRWPAVQRRHSIRRGPVRLRRPDRATALGVQHRPGRAGEPVRRRDDRLRREP